jgi:hypothetical protein
MIKSTIKFSIICGIFLYVLFLLSLRFGTNPFIDLNQLLFDVVIFFLFIFFSTKEYRRYQNGGILHFWEGMTIGFLLYAPAIIIFVTALYVHNLVDGSMLAEYQREAMLYLEERKESFLKEMGTEEQYQAQVAAIEEITFHRLVWGAALKKIIVGLFLTPIVSILLRKKPK